MPEATRQHLAFRTDAPSDVLIGLSTHVSADVRRLVALNRSTPGPTLIALSADPESQVLDAAIRNSSYHEARQRELRSTQQIDSRGLASSSGVAQSASNEPAPKVRRQFDFFESCFILFVVLIIGSAVLLFGVLIWAFIATMFGL